MSTILAFLPPASSTKAFLISIGNFLSGTFLRNGVDLRVGLTRYNNGIQADTLSSTDDAEALLEDIREWVAVEHKVNITDDAILRRAYQSQLDVQMTRELQTVNPKLEQIARKLSAKATTLDGKPREFVSGGFNIVPNDVGDDFAPMPFRFERKWGKPFSENIYFSQAQLRTQEHIEILEEMESLVAKT